MKKLIKRIPLPRSDDPSSETSSDGRGVEAKVFMCPECIEKCRNPQRLRGLQPALLAVWSGLVARDEVLENGSKKTKNRSENGLKKSVGFDAEKAFSTGK